MDMFLKHTCGGGGDTQLGYRNRITVRAEKSAMPSTPLSIQHRQKASNAIPNDSETRKDKNGKN